MALKVKTLNDPNTGDQIAPRTLVEAIVDRDGVNLGSTLEGLDTNKASNADLDVVNKRISNLVANTGEQTEGNAELIDIRVGANGIQYETAGDAVREQISAMSNYLSNFHEEQLPVEHKVFTATSSLYLGDTIKSSTGTPTSNYPNRIRTGRWISTRIRLLKLLDSTYQFKLCGYSHSPGDGTGWAENYVGCSDEWLDGGLIHKIPYEYNFVAFVFRRTDDADMTEEECEYIRETFVSYREVDINLEQKYAPADAKATGDAIRTTNQTISNLVDSQFNGIFTNIISLRAGYANKSVLSNSSKKQVRTEVISAQQGIRILCTNDQYQYNAVTYSSRTGEDGNYSYVFSKVYPYVRGGIPIIIDDPNTKYLVVSFARMDYDTDETEWTTEDSEAVLSSLSINCVTLEKRVKVLEDSANFFKDTLFEIREMDWSYFANETYPTGWRNAYMASGTGEHATSNFYMRTRTYCDEDLLLNAEMLEMTPPKGFGTHIYEYTSDGTYLGYHGQWSDIDSKLQVKVTKGNRYIFAIGRFNNADAAEYINDQEFVNSIKVRVFCTKSSEEELSKKPIRILGVGNSWTRDALRWLWTIANDAGKDVIVGHAYLGGSNLRDQYFGLHSTKYTYLHSNTNQVVHNTYQYWKYTSKTPVKTPDSGYNNGLSGIGVTLESVVGDEPWDYIIFMGSRGNGGVWEGWYDENTTCVTDNGEIIHWDIEKFLDDLVALLPEGTPTPKIGMAIPWVHPHGDTSSISEIMMNNYNDGIDPDSPEADENHTRDAMSERMHNMMQEMAFEVANYLGDKCQFMINVGLALYKARQNKYLCQLGYRLQRAQNNTHLAEGLPMYVAGLPYAYEILGIDRRDLNWFPEGTVDSSLDGDTGETVETTVTNTQSLADAARRCAWIAQMCE